MGQSFGEFRATVKAGGCVLEKGDAPLVIGKVGDQGLDGVAFRIKFGFAGWDHTHYGSQDGYLWREKSNLADFGDISRRFVVAKDAA